MNKIKNAFCFIKNNIDKPRVLVVVIITIILIISSVMVLIILSITRHSQIKMTAEEAEKSINDIVIPEHNYNFENLITEKGYKRYYKDGVLSSKIGIDVSYAQKNINWQKVKDAGIDFAMIRLGYRGYETGMLNLDEYFLTNIDGASAVGMDVGVYFFSQAVTEKEAEEEAEFVIEQIKYMNIAYPVVFDWEVVTECPARTDGIAGETLTKCCKVFCEKIEEAGYKPMVYASLNLLREQYDKYKLKEIIGYDLWLAEYKEFPEFPYDFKMWQYSEHGKIDGINYSTDLNVYFDD